MKASQVEVLSAMFDGEAVDPELLEEALADPAAVRTLMQFAEWRWDMRQDSRRPSQRFYDAVEPLLNPPRPSFWRRSAVPATIAASLIAGIALVGWYLWPPAAPPVRIASEGPRPPVVQTSPAPTRVGPTARSDQAVEPRPFTPPPPPKRASDQGRAVAFTTWRDVFPQ